ncbi:MAG: undecaprenyl-diphosphate phosphatase [Propionibacteriaceae bacterium]|jgi:undecaprenyl-diphosphatase|nr:undecaprenyl-diphosphate phosphatase [Propionibacteriaceae bacterium]
MNWIEAIVLGIVEGVTEFLPVSSTGHLTIVEKLFGLDIASRDVTAFTAIIQIGAIVAAIVYFWKDIVRLVVAWFSGLANKAKRSTDYRLGWAVIVGSLPIGFVGLALQNVIEGPLRSLWVVAGALILWSGVLFAADLFASRRHAAALRGSGPGLRQEKDLTVLDGLIIGLCQCIALVPGVSRSGATISAALFRGIDRTTATRWSFFLGIPALTASGVLQAVSAFDEVSVGVGWGPTIVAGVVSFVVAYISIAWLLKFVSSNRFTAFVVYRVVIGLVIVALLVFGVITAV